jgi:hypothetical protein
MGNNRLLRKSLFLLLLGFGVFFVFAGRSFAAGTCTAVLTWDKGSINKGESATESWQITGADSASGGCVDGGDINSFVSSLSFGPQSFTFKNIQKTLACTVTGYVNGAAACSASDTVIVNTTPPPAPPSSGGERCWFDEPGKTGYGFADQDPNYSVSINADICGPVQTDKKDQIGYCAGDLHWTSLNGPAWNAPALSDADYTATFNGGSFHNKSVKLSDGVRLTRSELLQNNTYSISIKKKDGTPAASCSVTLGASYYGAPGTGTPQMSVQPGVFPNPGDYTISTSKGSVNASFKYAPQIPGVISPIISGYIMPVGPPWLSGNGLGTFLGQFQKAIYYVIGHEPGAYGAWDLSDPFNPGTPSLRFLATNNGGYGPIQHLWPHASHGIGASVAENEDGGARMLDKNGLAEFYGNSVVCGSDPVYGYPLICHQTYQNGPTSISVQSFNNAQASFGQQIEDSSAMAPLVSYATPDGSFFGYAGEGSKVVIFDMTDLTGDANPPYMKPVGQISWAASDLNITNIPDRDTQFLIATIGSVGTGGANAYAPSYRVGEINPSTGKLKRQKTISFQFTGVPISSGANGKTTPDYYVYPDSSLRSVTISNTTYILVVEKSQGFTSTNFGIPGITDLTIGVYKFNPTDMSVSRKGSILAKSAGGDVFGRSGYFTVVTSDSNSAYPFIAVPRVKKTNSYITEDGVDFYSLKDVINSGGDLTPQPSLSLPAVTTWPVPVGSVVVNNWPFNGFLKTEGNKVNLYAYRNAFSYNGKADTTNGISMVIADYTGGPASLANGIYWGNPTIRVDKIDATSLTTTYSPPGGVTPPGGGGDTGGGGTPPTIGSGACYAKYPNDTQLRTLCEQIEALKRQVCALSPNLSICSSLQN